MSRWLLVALLLGCRSSITVQVQPSSSASDDAGAPRVDAPSHQDHTDGSDLIDLQDITGDLPLCQAGANRCGDECVNLRSDRLHCGECAHACPLDPRGPGGARWACIEGQCGSDIIDFSLGSGHICVVRRAQVVQCWGANDDGQLGDGSTTDRLTPTFVTGLNGVAVNNVTAGRRHTCANSEGGVITYCWGANEHGQLGTGSSGAQSSTPLRQQVGVVSSVSDMGLGENHSCAVGAGGTLWCWGLNDRGQLGEGTINDRALPTEVTRMSGITGVFGVGVGSAHTCALQLGGVAWCWGSDNGTLGAGTGRGHSAAPLRVQELPANIAQIVAGNQYSCARLNRGASYCWGLNNYGQLGDLTNVQRPTAVPIAEIQDLKWLYASASSSHTCAVNQNNRIYCWGLNESGQLGDGTLSNRNRPTPARTTTGLNFERVELGGGTTCGLTTSLDAIWCWGELGTIEPTVAALRPASTSVSTPVRLTVIP